MWLYLSIICFNSSIDMILFRCVHIHPHLWYCSVLSNVIIFIHYMFLFIHWYDIVQVCLYSSTFMILFSVEQCAHIYPLYVTIHPLIWYCSGLFIFIHIYDIVQCWVMCSYLSNTMILFSAEQWINKNSSIWYYSLLNNVSI